MKLIIDTDPGNGIPGSDIDDALAIGVALLAPDVELASPRYRGQTVGWGASQAASAPGAPNAEVCVEVDNARFMPMLLGILGAADPRSEVG